MDWAAITLSWLLSRPRPATRHSIASHMDTMPLASAGPNFPSKRRRSTSLLSRDTPFWVPGMPRRHKGIILGYFIVKVGTHF